MTQLSFENFNKYAMHIDVLALHTCKILKKKKALIKLFFNMWSSYTAIMLV
jgi:hypothetical protein